MGKKVDTLLVQFTLRGFFPLFFLFWALAGIPFLSTVPYYVAYDLAPPPTVMGSSRVFYRILFDTNELIDVVGLDINIFILIGLVLLIVIQMINPWRAHPVVDLGANLIVSAIIAFAWYAYLSSIIVTIPQWDPIVISTTPIFSLFLVPLQRIAIPVIYSTLPSEKSVA